MKPIKYLRRFDSKTKNAHLISFDDGKKYVVKMHKQGAERTLLNEWLGYHLARYMDLPVPSTHFVKIPQSFIEETPQLNEQVIFTKKQLATTYLEESQDAHQLDVKDIVNKHQLAGIIVLDYWLANLDRTRKNVLFTESQPGKHHLWSIDFGDSFRSFNWEAEELNQLPGSLKKSATHKLIASFIESEQEFRKQVSVVQAIPMLLIEEILSLVPDDWGITPSEKVKLTDTLLKRRKKILPNVIEAFIQEHYHPIH